jgi:hypothetical protein
VANEPLGSSVRADNRARGVGAAYTHTRKSVLPLVPTFLSFRAAP